MSNEMIHDHDESNRNNEGTTAPQQLPPALSEQSLNELLKQAAQGFSIAFRDVVNDTNSPEFRHELQKLASDSIEVVRLRAGGAEPYLVQVATADLKARALSLSQVPNLIAANRTAEFQATLDRVLDGLITFGVAAASRFLDTQLGRLSR